MSRNAEKSMAGRSTGATAMRVRISALRASRRSIAARREKELQWFTQKFDYRNQEKPWGSSKDAVPRILQKLTGKYME
jgi:hypothetical protein